MPKFHEEFRKIVASDLYREGLGYIVIIEFVVYVYVHVDFLG